MDLLMIIAVVVTILVALDVVALRFGADSRGTIGDERALSAGFGGRSEGFIR